MDTDLRNVERGNTGGVERALTRIKRRGANFPRVEHVTHSSGSAEICGLDLHWYAGGIRMIGGSGLGLLVVSIYALFTASTEVLVFYFLSQFYPFWWPFIARINLMNALRKQPQSPDLPRSRKMTKATKEDFPVKSLSTTHFPFRPMRKSAIAWRPARAVNGRPEGLGRREAPAGQGG